MWVKAPDGVVPSVPPYEEVSTETDVNLASKFGVSVSVRLLPDDSGRVSVYVQAKVSPIANVVASVAVEPELASVRLEAAAGTPSDEPGIDSA